MNTNIELIRRKIEQLRRMRTYLDYSLGQTVRLLPINNFQQLTLENHATLAAFRIRFSEFQEHLGSLMRSISREEEQNIESFSVVLLYMEKLGILDTVEQWKVIRELRNAVNHDYEENEERLQTFFLALTEAVPNLYIWFDRVVEFCRVTYKF